MEAVNPAAQHFEERCDFQLRVLERIKTMLAERCNIYLTSRLSVPLPGCSRVLAKQDFPIVAMDPSNTEQSHYLGFTVFANNAEIGFVNQVCEKIEMRIHSDHADGTLELIRLIPTFIHELAHVLRESQRPIKHTEIRKKKLKQMHKDHFAHDDGFYESFKRLLQDAEVLSQPSEELGIYELPSLVSNNKFSKRGLMRFDEVDLTDCPLSLCGNSKLWPHQSTDIIPIPEKLAAMETKKPLRVIVASNQGIKKPVFLEERNLAELLRQAQQKLRLKKTPTSAVNDKGVGVTQEDLATLSDDVILRIS